MEGLNAIPGKQELGTPHKTTLNIVDNGVAKSVNIEIILTEDLSNYNWLAKIVDHNEDTQSLDGQIVQVHFGNRDTITSVFLK